MRATNNERIFFLNKTRNFYFFSFLLAKTFYLVRANVVFSVVENNLNYGSKVNDISKNEDWSTGGAASPI